MKLSENILQELKEKKLSIGDLIDEYFIAYEYTQYDDFYEGSCDSCEIEVEVENVLKLLNENICSFQQIVDKFKSIKDERNALCSEYLLENKKVFKELIENNRLNTEDIRYLLNRIDNKYELVELNENTILLEHIVDKDLFKELVDKVKNFNKLHSLLRNKGLFEELIQNTLNSRLITEDLRYLLNTIDNDDDLYELCTENFYSFRFIFKEAIKSFVLNEEIVDQFNELIDNHALCSQHEINDIFELINFIETHNCYCYKDSEYDESDEDDEEDEDDEDYDEEDYNEDYHWSVRGECCIDQKMIELIKVNKFRIILFYVYMLDLTKEQKFEIVKVLRKRKIY